MKTLAAKLAALLAEAEQIAALESPTDEQVARIKALPAEIAEIKAQIDALQQIESVRSWAAQAQPMLDLGGAARTSGDGGGYSRDQAQPDPAVRLWAVKRFGEIPAAAEQIAKELYGSVSDNADYSQVLYAKQQAFVSYVRSGRVDNDRLARSIVLTPDQIVNIAAAGMSVKAIRANMVEGVDELGGFIVPEDFRQQMIERLPGMTVVRQRANVITTGSDVVTMPRVTGGTSRYPGAVRVTWVDEEPTATEAATNATFGQLRLSIFTTMAHTQVSKNFLEDAMIDVGGYLGREMSSAFAIDEDEQFLISAGAGKPQGILNGSAANNAPHNSDVTVVNSGSAAALTGDGVKKLPFAIAAQYRGGSPVFICNKATLQAIALLKDGQGRYLLGDERLQATGVPSSILGYGVAESEAMPDVAANVHALIFGDLKGYMVADRVGMSIQRYDDSTTAKGNAVVFVARRRVGGQVTEGWRLAAQKTAA